MNILAIVRKATNIYRVKKSLLRSYPKSHKILAICRAK